MGELYTSLLEKVKNVKDKAYALAVVPAAEVIHGVIDEYHPEDWTAAVPDEPSSSSIPVKQLLVVGGYLLLDIAAARDIAKAGKEGSKRMPTIGPISGVTRKLKYGKWFGEKMDVKPELDDKELVDADKTTKDPRVIYVTNEGHDVLVEPFFDSKKETGDKNAHYASYVTTAGRELKVKTFE